MNIPQSHQLLDIVPVAIAYHTAIRDPQGNLIDLQISDVNTVWSELTRIPKAHAVAHGLLQLVPALATGSFNWITVADRVLTTAKTEIIEQYSEVLKRWFHVTFYPVSEDEVVVLFTDITREMREINEKSESLKLMHDMVFELSQDRKVRHIFTLDESKLFRPRQEIIGKSLDEVAPEESIVRLRHALDKAYDTRTKQRYVHLSTFGDGKTWYDIEVQYIRINQIGKYYISVTDVTDAQEKEMALQASEAKFRSYSVHAPLGVIIVDNEFVIKEYNHHTSTILQSYVGQLQGTSLLHLLATTFADEVKNVTNELTHDAARSIEVELLEFDKPHLWLNLAMARIDQDSIIVYLQDITSRKLNEQQIRDNEHYLSTIMATMQDAFWLIDEDGIVVDVNNATLQMLGFSRDEIVGHPIFEIDPFISKEQYEAYVQRQMDRSSITFEAKHRRKNLPPIEVEIASSLLHLNPVRIMAFSRDISERKAYERRLHDENELFHSTISSMGKAVITTNEHGFIKVVNPTAEQLLHRSQDELLGHLFADVVDLRDEPTQTKRSSIVLDQVLNDESVELTSTTVLQIEDYSIPVEGKATPIHDQSGHVTGMVIIIHDVTEQHNHLKQIEFLSFHDPLTGLYNRRYMEDTMLRIDTPRNVPITVIMIDINGLKTVNDTCGHECGDECIKRTAESIRRACRADDIIARMGGDEFEIVLPHTNEEQALTVCQRIRQHVEGNECPHFKLTIGIGAATKTSSEQELRQVRKEADARMYVDKQMFYHNK